MCFRQADGRFGEPSGIASFYHRTSSFWIEENPYCSLNNLLPAEYQVSWHFVIQTDLVWGQESVYLKKWSAEPVGTLTTPACLSEPSA